MLDMHNVSAWLETVGKVCISVEMKNNARDKELERVLSLFREIIDCMLPKQTLLLQLQHQHFFKGSRLTMLSSFQFTRRNIHLQTTPFSESSVFFLSRRGFLSHHPRALWKMLKAFQASLCSPLTPPTYV